MTRSRADWFDKANAYAAAWAVKIGSPCSARNAALGLSVGEHETKLGDAWPGSNNVGACTLRGLSDAERACLQSAGVHAVLTPAAARDRAEMDAVAALTAGGLPPSSDAVLHVDSAPRSGPYFTWFAAFPTLELGMEYFLHVLAQQRVSCCAILNRGGNAGELAAAMYRSHYFTGFHDPHQPGGDEANIGDYAAALAALQPSILAALDGWSPGAEPPAYTEPAELDLSTTLGVQQALNRLCPDCAPLVEDGILGPKTAAAIATWQRAHGLAPDGIVGAATVRSLRDALG